jgi:hypothetical protein
MESYLDQLQRAIAAVTRGVTPTDLARHREGQWSAAEILEHLYLTYTSTVKGFERCLKTGRPQVSPPTAKQRLAAVLVVGAGLMPGRREAPPYTRPRGTPAEKVVAEIGVQIAAMDRIIAHCEARYGKRVKLLNHFVLGPLTGSEWRKFHWVHGRHHIKQIWRLRTPAS